MSNSSGVTRTELEAILLRVAEARGIAVAMNLDEAAMSLAHAMDVLQRRLRTMAAELSRYWCDSHKRFATEKDNKPDYYVGTARVLGGHGWKCDPNMGGHLIQCQVRPYVECRKEITR
jgi:hypothetical protein